MPRGSKPICPLLGHPNNTTPIAASTALKTLGDASFADEVAAMSSRELDGRAVRMGRENAAALRKGASMSEEVKSLRDEFEKLRDENAKLRDRLERIEARP